MGVGIKHFIGLTTNATVCRAESERKIHLHGELAALGQISAWLKPRLTDLELGKAPA